jgi:uncharacterized protein (TIGR02271 family)
MSTLNTKAITSAVLLSAAGLVFTACSSTRGGSTATYDDTGYSQSQSMSEPSGASASGSAGQSSGDQSGQTEVRIPLHEETVAVGKRTVDAGQVTLRKVITTETINQPVELRRETLVIDRQDAGAQGSASSSASSASSGGTAASGSSAPFEEKTMTIRLQREEPVVQKQTIVRGNVVARRNSQTEQQNIREQVRRENVEVDKGNAGENVVLHGGFNEIKEGAGAQPSGAQQNDSSQPKDSQQQQQSQP